MKVAVTTFVFCVASLLALGLVMLYSSSMTQVGARYLVMQSVWCALGLIACTVMAAVDYHIFKKLAWPIFGGALLLLLLLVLMRSHPVAGLSVPNINGAWRWFDFHGVRFQPSELGKIALIITLSWYADRYQRWMPRFWRGIAIPLGIIGGFLFLIFIEPDRGTTILMAAVCGSMLLLAGVQWKFIIPPILLAGVGLVVSILHDPMRMRRIFSWLDLEQHKDGAGYQAYQAMIALGSGGWWGLGLGNGRQKLGFVPEHHTDFIFSIIGEELGLIATVLVILTFVIIAICGFFIALHARDTFGTLLSSGITLLISLQAAINIGVVTSALPNKGLALPFISYGGSSLLSMLTCVGILLSVARQAGPLKITATEIISKPDENPFAAKVT